MAYNFQELILNLSKYWSDYGCIIQQPYDIEKGASTMNPATFLRALGPEPYSTAMIEPCRRPTDARYGENPNRLGHYFQYQVIRNGLNEVYTFDNMETALSKFEEGPFFLGQLSLVMLQGDICFLPIASLILIFLDLQCNAGKYLQIKVCLIS